MSSKKTKRIAALAKSLSISKRGAANLDKSQQANRSPKPPSEPVLIGRPLMILQVDHAVHDLVDRRPEGATFVTSINSYEHVDDRVGPNGEVNMVPLTDVSFTMEPTNSNVWFFEGALAFIDGELWDGDRRVSAELLEREGGLDRLREIVRQEIRIEHPALHARIVDLRVREAFVRGGAGGNFIVLVRIDISLPPRTLPQLLRALRVDATFGVQIGRSPRTGYGPTIEIAHEDLRRKQQDPMLFADSGRVQWAIDATEHQTLASNGAADENEIHVLRTFRNEHRVTFSDRCDRCPRMIHLGNEEREAACVCGRKYRVVFDLPEAMQWMQPQGPLCMDCSTEHTLTEPHEGRNPWRLINAWQHQCHLCATKKDVRDAVATRGKIQNEVLVTKPVTGNNRPRLETTKLDALREAEDRLRESVATQREALQKMRGPIDDIDALRKRIMGPLDGIESITKKLRGPVIESMTEKLRGPVFESTREKFRSPLHEMTSLKETFTNPLQETLRLHRSLRGEDGPLAEMKRMKDLFRNPLKDLATGDADADGDPEDE